VNVDLCSDDFDMLGGRTKDIPAFFSYNNSQLTNSLQINNSLTDVENILDNVDYEKEFKFNYELPSVINDLSIPTV
jgi:hypothetical protein